MKINGLVWSDPMMYDIILKVLFDLNWKHIVTQKKLKYKLHIPIIAFTLLFHSVFIYFYTQFYLINVGEKLSQIESSTEGKLYQSGNYIPIYENKKSNKIPKKYVYALVNNYGNTTEEIYYTKKGQKIVALYKNKKLVKVSRSSEPKKINFIIPIVGFLFLIFAVFREAIRRGTFSSWQIGRSPDYVEKTCYLYGISLFAFGILILILKEL